MSTRNAAPRITTEVVERKIGDLDVDPGVQRTLSKARVKEIAAEFDPNALAVLTTSVRKSPKIIHVVDGQHRLRAAEMVGYAGPIRTLEYRGLTIPEEAALFRKLNTTQKPSRVDHFLIACVEQDPDAVRLASFIMAHGWSVAPSAGEARISAIAALERVYKRSPEAADATLSVLTRAFGHRPQAVQGQLIEGLGIVLAKHGGNVKLNDMSDRLAKVAGGPDGIISTAKGASFTRTGNVSASVAKLIVELYNARLRSNALPV
jgi:hypothetical protein